MIKRELEYIGVITSGSGSEHFEQKLKVLVITNVTNLRIRDLNLNLKLKMLVITNVSRS